LNSATGKKRVQMMRHRSVVSNPSSSGLDNRITWEKGGEVQTPHRGENPLEGGGGIRGRTRGAPQKERGGPGGFFVPEKNTGEEEGKAVKYPGHDKKRRAKNERGKEWEGKKVKVTRLAMGVKTRIEYKCARKKVTP